MISNKKLRISYSFIVLFIASCSSVQVTEEAVYEDSIQSIEVSSNRAESSTPTESKAVLANATVYFEFDSFNLSTRSIQALKSITALMQDNPEIEITIAGHADERGTREYNLALGQRRAESVADYLKLKGISRSRLTIKSYGEEMPMVAGSNERSWARNRRAEIN
ncbi:peptidoglycan-associated lipoprotein Pal [Gammaproteobacteria bacterium]|jgi:peptidoglycan-associated lipoprotein|nr:peptidoglycan-associated lipoprotein Pal [Gammaproteobacteria bacterium]|tara:strand:+ start:3969 stop:4463 length:495 start_codon:yes stop_codon:yes gene_type:complete